MDSCEGFSVYNNSSHFLTRKCTQYCLFSMGMIRVWLDWQALYIQAIFVDTKVVRLDTSWLILKKKENLNLKSEKIPVFFSNFDFCCTQNKNMRYVSMRLQKGRGDEWILIWLPPTLVRCCFSYFIHGHPPQTCHFYNIQSGIFETLEISKAP